MHRIYQVLVLTASNYRRWRTDPRVGLVFALGFIACFLLSSRAVTFAQERGSLLQIAEPFIWTFGEPGSILTVSLLLILLFADMPFISAATPFCLARTTRMAWLAAQILYVCTATFLYTLFIFAATCALCAHMAFPGNQWSETAAALGYSGAGAGLALPASIKTMETTTPYACAAQIFMLMLGYTLVLAALMLSLNLWKGTAASIVGAFTFSLAGLLLTPDVFMLLFDLPTDMRWRANVAAGWVSPLNHATYDMHNFGYDRLPRLWQTYILFAAAAALLFAAAAGRLRCYSFRFAGQEG